MKFKIGDKIKITGAVGRYSRFNGKSATVTSPSDVPGGYMVRFDDILREYSASPRCMELLDKTIRV